MWRWDQQEPFGVNVPDENPSSMGAFDFPLRFPGQYSDKETNLFYNYFRDYDAAIGRYVESDPLGLVAGLNTYLYVDGAPLISVDLEGLIKRVLMHDFQILVTSGTVRGSNKVSGSVSFADRWQIFGNVPDCFVLLDTLERSYDIPLQAQAAPPTTGNPLVGIKFTPKVF